MAEQRITRTVDGVEVASTEHATCDDCGVRGLVGDYPGVGAIVAPAHPGGAGVCDACEARRDEAAESGHACVGCGEPADVPPGPGEVEWQCRACADAPADE